MSNHEDIDSRYRNLLKVLRAQHRTLAEAGAPSGLLDTYRALLRYLSGLSSNEVTRILRSDTMKGSATHTLNAMSPSEASELSLDQIDRLVADDNTPRKTLEAIAIGRFQVPRGSMRSYANVGMLKEKLTTLVQNERAHRTISAIAQHPRS